MVALVAIDAHNRRRMRSCLNKDLFQFFIRAVQLVPFHTA